MCQTRHAREKSGGLGKQQSCRFACQKVLLASARHISPKIEAFVGFGFEFDVHFLVASLLKRVLMSCSLLDVSILSLTFGVLYFSLFFIGFTSISSFAVGAQIA